MLSDVSNIGNIFTSNLFDAVIGLDIIEHLHRNDSEKLVYAMECIARKKVIIITPNGKTKGHKSDIPYMKHLCGWNRNEFYERGYCIFGIGGWKGLRNSREYLRGFSSGCILNFQKKIFNLTQLYVVSRPKLAFGMLCILRKI